MSQEVMAKAIPSQEEIEFACEAHCNYGRHLETLRQAGRIRHWAYKTMRLRLGRGHWLTPEFLVVRNEGTIELHLQREAERPEWMTKVAAARTLYPWLRWRRVTKTGKRWLAQRS